MGKIHYAQIGVFHITTNARHKIPWCVIEGIPQIIIDNLVMTKNMQSAFLHAFCILPNHVHIILTPGMKGLSTFMHSFKRNSMRDMRRLFNPVAEDRILRDHDHSQPEGGRYGSSATELMNISKIAWQKGFHDERIRDQKQYSTALNYVQGNAMKHGLVSDIIDWPWTSIHFAHAIDPPELW